MKNLGTLLSNRLDYLRKRWRALPVKKQHRYTLLLFTGYALLSVIVLLKVCFDGGNPGNGITIEHIENPIKNPIENRVIRHDKPAVSLQDSLSMILKHKMYER